MRTTLALPFVLCFACHPKDPPAPSEYIRFQYAVGSGDPVSESLEFDPGTQPCGRMAKEIKITGQKGKVYFQLSLHDAATMPAAFQANSKTDGKVNLDVSLPLGAGDPALFSSFNPGFSCLIRFGGPDPFAEFDGTFSCTGGSGPSAVAISGGEIHATMCQPM